METRPHYNFIDILWAPIAALSARKIFVMTFFLCAALILYDIMAYIAIAVDGQRVSFAWATYGMFPAVKSSLSGSVALAISGVGCALALLAIMMGFFGVSAIEIEKLRGNPFFSSRQAIMFSFKRLPQVFLSELSIGLFLGLIALLFVLFGLVGRIPYLGEWVVSIFFVFPGFIVALLSLFIFAVFQMSIILLPATAAAERQGETFTAILETFSTIMRQPFRWVAYTIFALVAGKLASFVYAYAAYRAVQLSVWVMSFGSGDKIKNLVASGLSHLPLRSDIVHEMLSAFPGADLSFSVSRWTAGSTDQAAGYLMGVMLFLIFASIVAYFLTVVAVGQARGYVAIRYFKDGHKISEEKSLFFEPEHVNPPIEGEG